ncbi:MAG TPA: FKBP-type peptidyl-prolyl cis-trans isomerase [Solirubrobacteraceae bacterium]|jgi:peptidylprolyl isomerase|nr:FKBP-type peptidyl-prolyl cis-trans isomerase [Solirubrobacteraceae bacterium]
MRIQPRHTLAAGAAAAILIAGCGSTKANPAIQPAPSAAQGPITVPAPITTPKTGPLSKEPTIAKSNAPAPTKLIVKDIVTGTGAALSVGQTATVNYVGATYPGAKVFDASWKRGTPAEFQLMAGALIPGWVQGLPGMRIGGRRELIIPGALAYGKQGNSAAGIAPNQPLIFIIDLLGAS